MTRSGWVTVYNNDTGHGVVVAEDEDGKLGDDRYEISYKTLSKGVGALRGGQRVKFEVLRNRAVRVEPDESPSSTSA